VPDLDRLESPDPGATFWSGTISFGLVSVPVDLLAANRSRRVSLRMVSSKGKPLSRRYFTGRDEKELKWEQIVRGYEIEKDSFVVVTDEELDRLAPERTRDIDLRVFVPVDAIDPMYFDRAYYLVPSGSSTKAYRLLAKVMEETKRAGIATFVMRAKEYLVAILAENGILRAETLRFADELRTPEDVGLPTPRKPKPATVTKVETEIRKLAEERLDPDELVDRGAERMLKLARKKARARKDVVELEPEPEQEDESVGVIDLMERLQRSLSGESGPTRSRAGPGISGASDDLVKSSKAELYERAQELEIPGRSGMSREELIEAIRAAS
jgi:DNA end-binding protein Ku